MRLLGRLIHRPVAIGMFYGALVLGGIFAFTRLPLELAPFKDFPRLSVQTFWWNASPETVEMFITAPIEEIANTVRGVRKVSSTSEEGNSNVEIEFDPGVDMNFARLELSEKLAAFAETLPPVASPPSIRRYVPKDLRDLQGFLSYSLSGDRPPHELRKFAQEKIAPVLLSIRGIASVQVYGGETREIQVEIQPDKLVAFGLRIEEVNARLRQLQFSAPIGSIDGGQGRSLIAVRNASVDVDELKALTIASTPTGSPVRLGDLGVVREGLSEPRSFYRINGRSTVTIVIDKEPNTNTLRLADEVFARLEPVKKSFPESFTLLKQSDNSEQMRRELGKVYQEILISLICILAVLVVFLRNLSAPLLILSSILFSIAGTLLLFWAFGIGLNLLTIAGLVLGFGRLVDDSIVVLENIHRHQSEPSAASIPRVDLISSSASEIALPVVASTLTTVGALLPLNFLPEDLKPYFLDFGLAVGISLLMSLLVSFTLIPTVAAHVDMQPAALGLLQTIGTHGMKAYRRLVQVAMRRRGLVLAITLWMFGLPVWLLPDRIDSSGFFAILYNNSFGTEAYRSAKPYVDHLLGGASHLFFRKVQKGEVWQFESQTYLVVTVGFPQGTEIERYNEIAEGIEKEVLQSRRKIEKVTTKVLPDYAVVRIDIPDSIANTAFPFELKNRLVIFAAQTGGATISVSGFGPGFYTGGESAPSFYVKVLGYNYNRVKEIAERFRERIERNPRVAEVDIDRSFGRWSRMYELAITIDRDAVAGHGLTVADVVRAIRTYTRGALEESEITVHGERLPYSVKFAGYKQFSTEDLHGAVVANSRGEQVRLRNLIRFEERRVPSKIIRENQQYVRWISFEYKGPYRFGDQFVDATIKAMPLPSGYSFDRSWSSFWFSQESQISLIKIALLALLIVFMVTASLYESFLKPFIIILAVPFSLIGLFLAYYLTDMPFGRGGYGALVLLIGIVVTNSIVLVDFISRRVATEGFSFEIVASACSLRLRPVLMTTLTTIGGLLPLLIMGERSGLWYSLSLGTIGGLLSSTVLTLVVVPVVYATFYRARRGTLPPRD